MANLLLITSNTSSYTVKPAVIRAVRAENNHPAISKYDYLQSLTSNYGGETDMRRADKLKEDVKRMLEKVEEPLDKMELIDTIQRLGISYHFVLEIKEILASFCTDEYKNSVGNEKDLYAKSLEFRLLREHGFQIPQEVFNEFKDEFGNFKACLCEDIKGMLYLFEASYLSFPGENIMDEARDFTEKHLKQMNLQQKSINENNDLFVLVDHALKLPLHWRMLRMEARWFIDVYGRRQDKVSTLLELAKLDFNMVQAEHQEDLKHLSSWWNSTGLAKKYSFARDRLMENFIWAIGMNFKPEFRSFIKMMTKLTCLVTVVDDIYDEHGTSLQELELFTDAVVRWEISAIEKLPDYLKICFLAIYNCSNEMAYETLKEQDFCNISYLKDSWANICESYLQEAKWCYSGYTPTMEEYMKNGTISVAGPLGLVHTYFNVTNPIRKEALELLENTHVIRWSSEIMRLANDLGISQDEVERVDNPKAVECYMHETGVSMADARNHLKYMIGEAWKNLNEFRVADSPFNQTFIDTAVNLARIAQHIYRHGDGHGIEDNHTIMALLIKPIPLS